MCAESERRKCIKERGQDDVDIFPKWLILIYQITTGDQSMWAGRAVFFRPSSSLSLYIYRRGRIDEGPSPSLYSFALHSLRPSRICWIDPLCGNSLKRRRGNADEIRATHYFIQQLRRRRTFFFPQMTFATTTSYTQLVLTARKKNSLSSSALDRPIIKR